MTAPPVADGTGTLPEWPCAYGGPVASGHIRHTPDDFVVEEELAFEPSGDGDHLLLKLEKRGENTDYVARQLARFSGVRRADVGYAGLKDRQARTVQWFSLPRHSGVELDWRQFESASVRVLTWQRHRKKLKKGALAGNRFQITVRQLRGDRARIEARLSSLAETGVPNYFGPQRFGRAGHNLLRAESLFDGSGKERDRHQRGLYYSAARSYLFNEILALRVRQGSWNQVVAGDALMFDGGHSYFKTETVTGDAQRRVAAAELHPTGALWGLGDSDVSAEAAELETRVAQENPLFCRGLEASGLSCSRRALRLLIRDLSWAFPEPEVLTLGFFLPAGAFATTVLRELLDTGASPIGSD